MGIPGVLGAPLYPETVVHSKPLRVQQHTLTIGAPNTCLPEWAGILQHKGTFPITASHVNCHGIVLLSLASGLALGCDIFSILWYLLPILEHLHSNSPHRYSRNFSQLILIDHIVNRIHSHPYYDVCVIVVIVFILPNQT